MEKFCPFIDGECKKEQCVMWTKDCTITQAIIRYTEKASPKEVRASIKEEEEVIVPEEIKNTTPEELAIQLYSFVKKEGIDASEPIDDYYDEYFPDEIVEQFWEEKGVDRSSYSLPRDIEKNIDKAENIAQQLYAKDQKEKYAERRKKEKEHLEEVVERCLAWANENEIKKITHRRLKTFLLESEEEVLEDTRYSLYDRVNARLTKQKKQKE